MAPCKLWTVRCGPSTWAQWPVRGAARIVVHGGEGRWCDGPRPPDILTGLPCQGAGAAFMVAIAPSIALTTSAWWLSPTEHTLCLYLHPRHHPRRLKLMQAPGRPILSWLIDTFPCVHKSWSVDVGYSRLNDATIFWQSGGIKALDVGCGPATVGHLVRVAAGIGAPVNFGGGPKNNASGHVSVSWMEQSLTSWRTARPSAEQGRLSPSSQLSHTRKNCLAS